MTLEEKIIATGYTDVNFCPQFGDFKKEVEQRLKRPVLTHELPKLKQEIKELFREDFIKMCLKSE